MLVWGAQDLWLSQFLIEGRYFGGWGGDEAGREVPVSHHVFVAEDFVEVDQVAFSCCSEEETSCSDRTVFTGNGAAHRSGAVYFSFFSFRISEFYSRVGLVERNVPAAAGFV